jgi:hypothetical protein
MKEAAFSNIVMHSGAASSLGLFFFPSCSKDGLALSTLVASSIAIVCALTIHCEEQQEYERLEIICSQRGSLEAAGRKNTAK